MSVPAVLCASPGDTRDDTVRAAQDAGLDVVCEEHALAAALERLARGDAGVLVLGDLRAACASLREVAALLDWLGRAGAQLVVLDGTLDTRRPAGRRTAALLSTIDGWEREPGPGRRGPGRPGLAAHAPELARRIAARRAQGASLQAIADELNAGGVPTPRGGALWRASSVQSALGYRRPRPPGPHGAPPPPRPPGHHPPPAGPRPRP